MIADEAYNLTSKESTTLSKTSSLGRYQHTLKRIDDTTFALGGLLENGSAAASVDWFDWKDMTWKQHDTSLLSKNTSFLAVTSFPLSAVDCHTGCTCGLAASLGNLLELGLDKSFTRCFYGVGFLDDRGGHVV